MPGARFLSCLLKALLPFVGVSPQLFPLLSQSGELGTHGRRWHRRHPMSWLVLGPLFRCLGTVGSSNLVRVHHYGAHSVFLPGVVMGQQWQ